MWPFKLVLAIYCLKLVGYLLLRLRQKKEEKKVRPAGDQVPVSVDILLPMYNEEKVVIDTIRNLLKIQYSTFSIIVVDDGSTDASYDIVKEHFDDHPCVRLIRQPNAGKSAALNRAISLSQAEILVSIDADTWVRPDAIGRLVEYFADKRVAAVAGFIKVGNRVNLLTDMQYFEYVSIWNNDRACSDVVNSILVVPGALGAFRRSAVDAVGGFRSEAMAEDTELTLRLLNNNHVIRNAIDAVAYTEAPDNLRMFFRQRVRWTAGLAQGLLQHNKTLFANRNRFLSFLFLPFTWFFRIILPFFLPLVDYYFIWCYFFLKCNAALFWWLPLVIAETSITLYLLSRYKERVGFVKLLLLQRLYRHLLLVNYGYIFVKWLNGTLFTWKKIDRKNSIQLENSSISAD